MNNNYRLDLKTYISVVAVFGFAQGLFFGLVFLYEGIMLGEYLQTVGIYFLIPIFTGIVHILLGLITYPVYKVISDLMKGHKITRLTYKTS